MLIAFLFLFILVLVERNLFSNSIKIIKDSISQNIKISASGSAIIIVLILAILFKLPLSNIAAEVTSFVTGLGGNYQTGNYPIVYLFAISSSIPLIVVSIVGFFPEKNWRKKQL